MRTCPRSDSLQFPDPPKRSLHLSETGFRPALELTLLPFPAPPLTCGPATSLSACRGLCPLTHSKQGSARERPPPEQPCPVRTAAILGSVSRVPHVVLLRSSPGAHSRDQLLSPILASPLPVSSYSSCPLNPVTGPLLVFKSSLFYLIMTPSHSHNSFTVQYYSCSILLLLLLLISYGA